MLEAICFDLDGTLARYHGDFVELVGRFASGSESSGLESPPDTNTLLQTFSRCEKRAGHVTLPKILTCLAAELDINMDEAKLQAVARNLLESYVKDMRLLPGAEAALQLAGTHTKLALISNGPSDMQRAVLAELELEHYFDAILVSGDADIGVRKPDAGIFELALKRLGVAPANALMIGDNLEADIAGAAWLGMQTLHVAQTPSAAETAVKDVAAYLEDRLI